MEKGIRTRAFSLFGVLFMASEHPCDDARAGDDHHTSCADSSEVAGIANHCPICLSTISGESFLDPCFHRFCFHCILQWAEMVASHPSLEGSASLECPLCKVPSNSIVQIVMGALQRYYPYGSPSGIKPFLLSEMHYQRLAVYRQDLHCRVKHALSHNPKRKKLFVASKNEFLKHWLQRELQALMQDEDVDIVVYHVLGVLEHFEKKQKAQPEILNWKVAMVEAVRPFLAEDADNFYEELNCFLFSGLQISAYDDVVGEIISTTRPNLRPR